MGYQSKTYSLSDEVVDAIEGAKAGGTSPNRFLRELMGLDNGDTGMRPVSVRATAPVIADPAEIPGIQVGASNLPKNAQCRHCGNRFAGVRGASMCPECGQNGHRGAPAECSICTEGMAI